MLGVLMRSPGGAATVAIAGRNSKSERANAILFEYGDKGFPLIQGGPETYLSCNCHRAMEALLCTYKVHSGMEKSVHKRASIARSEEHTSELQSRLHLVCRLLLE